jgi:hypothetical protein
MKLQSVITEANVAAKIKDPKTIKMLGIAMRHDSSLPKAAVAKLGPKPDDQAILKLWSDVLDASLRRTNYGDISADGKFDEWLTRLYINGIADYEDINGEGGDALGAWKALSTRGRLKQPHQDFNKFKNLKQIQAIVQSREYQNELRRIKDSEVIEKHKREKKEITLIDDDKFLVTMPFNYGACYTFNNSAGFQASFCTGSSQGLTWFNRYAPDGPIISIIDKANVEDANGKWQMHGPTGQMNNGNQTLSYTSGDKKFADLYPGLLKKIVAAVQAKGEEIKANSTEIVSGGYDIEKAVTDIKNRLPYSWASEAPEPEPEADNEDGPGTYLVTHTASGRTARIEGESKEDVQQKLLARHPNVSLDDFTFERQAEQQENFLQ